MARWVLLAVLPLVLACEQPAPPPAEPTPAAQPDWDATSVTDPVTHLAIGGAQPSAILYALTRPQGTSDSVLWRSADAAATWQRLDLPARRILDLAVNDKDGQSVYIAGEGGIYRSADGGTSWSRTLSDMPGLRVVVSPADPALLYAATGSSSSAATWRSVDGGATWEQLRKLQGTLCIWTFPLIAPDRAAGERVYVSYYCAAGRTSSAPLSRSDDRWSTTREILTGTFLQGEVRAFLFPEAGQFSANGDRGVVLARRGPFRGSALLRTDDGGQSWSRLLEYPSVAGYVPNVVAAGLQVQEAGAERILLGLGGEGRGVIGSDDGGSSFWPVGRRPIGPAKALVLDPATGRLYAGTDQGVWFIEQPYLLVAHQPGPAYGPWQARIRTAAGGGTRRIGDQPRGPLDTLLSNPQALALAPDGSLLVATGEGALRLRGEGPMEMIKPAATLRVGVPAVAGDGWVVFSEYTSIYSPARLVAAISPAGETRWVAGTRPPGLSGSYAAQPPGVTLSRAAGVATDVAGTVYIADAGERVVWRVGRDGSAQVVAGSGHPGWSGDGLPATEADLQEPWALALDPERRLIIVDRGGQRVLRVEDDGRLATIAGSGLMGYSGDGGPAAAARLAFPSSATVDAAGRVYIADALNHAVRVVDLDGRIWTLAGTGSPGRGDNGPASGSALNLPLSLAWDGSSGLYVADYGNNRVRWIGPVGSAPP